MFSFHDIIKRIHHEGKLFDNLREVMATSYCTTVVTADSRDNKFIVSMNRTTTNPTSKVDTIFFIMTRFNQNIYTIHNVYYIYSINDVTNKVYSSSDTALYFIDTNILQDIDLECGLNFILDDRNKKKIIGVSLSDILSIYFHDIRAAGG